LVAAVDSILADTASAAGSANFLLRSCPIQHQLDKPSIATMMAALGEAQPRGSAEFIESSILEAVVPSNSGFDAEDEIASWDGSTEEESSSVLPFLSQRQVLLFGQSAMPHSYAYSYLLLGSR
jgi:hypothetical protein